MNYQQFSKILNEEGVFNPSFIRALWLERPYSGDVPDEDETIIREVTRRLLPTTPEAGISFN